MRIKAIALLIGVAVAATVGAPVLAAPDDHGKAQNKRAMVVHGTVLDADGDDDALTAGPIVVSVTKANGNARRAGMAGDVTLAVTDGTKFSGAASSLSDLADGDNVKVSARRDGLGGYVAKKVKEKAPEVEEAPEE